MSENDNSDLLPLDELMSEKAVYEKYGHMLSERELREARMMNAIGFIDTRKGPFYSQRHLSDYFKLREQKPCPKTNKRLSDQEPEADDNVVQVPGARKTGSSRSGTNGSHSRREAPHTNSVGMTKALEKSAAAALAHET